MEWRKVLTTNVIRTIVVLSLIQGASTYAFQDYFIEIGRDEQTGAIFRVKQGNPSLVKREPCVFNMDSKEILGVVPNGTNFLNDELVLNLARIGIREFEQRCPQVTTQTERLQRTYHNNRSTFSIHVELFGQESWAQYQRGSYFSNEVYATYVVNPAGAIELQSMTNKVKERAVQAAQAQARLQAQQEQKRKLEDQRRVNEANLAKQQAEDAAASRKRYREFATKYGVREFVPLSLLSPNPYVYQGQVVAIPLQFDQMTSANTAKFVVGGLTQYWMVVAGVPRDLFRSRSPAIVAVRIGQREPLFNFAGVHICEKDMCEEILPFSMKSLEQCVERHSKEYKTSSLVLSGIAEKLRDKCANELSK